MNASRADLVRRAFRLEWLGAGWMAVEAGVAIASGITAHSLSLIAFGVDSVIELAAVGVLLWRLTVELRLGADFPEAVEHRASRIAAALLFALSIYVAASAVWGLWQRVGQHFSAIGLALTLLAVPTMFYLARAKLRLAERIGSRALRADAVESLACLYLSAVVVLGLLVQLVSRAWWIDSATGLAIVPLLVKEGREAWRGDGD